MAQINLNYIKVYPIDEVVESNKIAFSLLQEKFTALALNRCRYNSAQ